MIITCNEIKEIKTIMNNNKNIGNVLKNEFNIINSVNLEENNEKRITNKIDLITKFYNIMVKEWKVLEKVNFKLSHLEMLGINVYFIIKNNKYIFNTTAEFKLDYILRFLVDKVVKIGFVLKQLKLA